jgi:beta-glucosidase
MNGRTYRYFQGKPLFPFGYGLSYTTFSYENIQLEKETVALKDTVCVNVKIRNSGKVDGDEVVQLYVRDPREASDRPLRSLKSFSRIHLSAGDSKIVRLLLAVRDLRVFDEAAQDLRIIPGKYEIEVGSSSADIRLNAQVKVQN